MSVSINVAGYSPLSTVDWPGKLVSTVFFQGCPLSCVYCHNPDIISTTKNGEVSWGNFVEFLQKRRNLLDGVVFSGGEPTRQKAILGAIEQVRSLGYRVGIHTAGVFPGTLEKAIPNTDWVGLDIKALPSDYFSVVGNTRAGVLAFKSLDLVLTSGVPYEVRTTVYPNSVVLDNLVELATLLLECGVTSYRVQKVRTTGVRKENIPLLLDTLDVFDSQITAAQLEIQKLGFDDFAIR